MNDSPLKDISKLNNDIINAGKMLEESEYILLRNINNNNIIDTTMSELKSINNDISTLNDEKLEIVDIINDNEKLFNISQEFFSYVNEKRTKTTKKSKKSKKDEDEEEKIEKIEKVIKKKEPSVVIPTDVVKKYTDASIKAQFPVEIVSKIVVPVFKPVIKKTREEIKEIKETKVDNILLSFNPKIYIMSYSNEKKQKTITKKESSYITYKWLYESESNINFMKDRDNLVCVIEPVSKGIRSKYTANVKVIILKHIIYKGVKFYTNVDIWIQYIKGDENDNTLEKGSYYIDINKKAIPEFDSSGDIINEESLKLNTEINKLVSFYEMNAFKISTYNDTLEKK